MIAAQTHRMPFGSVDRVSEAKLEVRYKDARSETWKSGERADALEMPGSKLQLLIPYEAPILDVTSRLPRFSEDFPGGLLEEEAEEWNRRGLVVVDDESWHLVL